MSWAADTSPISHFPVLVANYARDKAGRLLSLQYLTGITNVHNFQYSMDTSGNRTQIVETIGTGSPTTLSCGYDWLDRLTSCGSNSYSFDGCDNRLTLNSQTLTYNLADQITSWTSGSNTTTFVHDLDGRMTSTTLGSSVTTFAWSGFNNMVYTTPTGEVEAYDTGGTRRLRSDGSRYFDFISENHGPLTNPNVSYIQGPQLLGLDRGGTVSFYLIDALEPCARL